MSSITKDQRSSAPGVRTAFNRVSYVCWLIVGLVCVWLLLGSYGVHLVRGV